MFQSITQKRYLGRDETTDQHMYLFEIEDSLLGTCEVITIDALAKGIYPQLPYSGMDTPNPFALITKIETIIRFYSDNDRDVASILFIYGKYHCNDYTFPTIESFFKFISEYVPAIKSYEQHIENLLLLQ